MKTPIVFLIILSCPIFLFAQETVFINTQRKGYNSHHEEYYVLKSDRNVKHGPYKRIYTWGKQVTEEGNYKNGKKDGLWIEYGWDGKSISLKGNFANGVPIGVWEFYRAGKLTRKYDYDAGTMLFSDPPQIKRDTTLFVYNGSDSVKTKVDEAPEMVFGPSGWQQYLNRSLKYPQDAIDNEKMGTVVIGFVINTDGTASDFWIKRSAYKSLDEEALRVVSQMEHKWIPAKVNGQPVKVSFLQPIVFRMEKG
jgi:TonB family protein